jgi:hypothetical protein
MVLSKEQKGKPRKTPLVGFFGGPGLSRTPVDHDRTPMMARQHTAAEREHK